MIAGVCPGSLDLMVFARNVKVESIVSLIVLWQLFVELDTFVLLDPLMKPAVLWDLFAQRMEFQLLFRVQLDSTVIGLE